MNELSVKTDETVLFCPLRNLSVVLCYHTLHIFFHL